MQFNAKKYLKELFSNADLQDPVIDFVRALSVLSIICFHVTVGILQIYPKEQAEAYVRNMPAILQPLWHFEKGVDVFFLLSALVLGQSLFRNLSIFDTGAAVTFYKKRFLRIYPLFFVALALYAAAQWQYCAPFIWSNLLLINNFFNDHRTIIPVGWSLIVEVQYYAILPIGFLILKCIRSRLTFLLLAFIASFFVNGIILLKYPSLYQRPLTDIFLAADRQDFANLISRYLYESNLGRFGPFIFGLVLAYLRVFYWERVKNIVLKFSSFLTITMGVLLCLVVVFTPLYGPGSWFYLPFDDTINFLVLSSNRQILAIGVSFLMLGFWSISDGKSRALLFVNWRGFKIVSKLAFPIYLFHFPLIALSAVLIYQTTDVKKIGEITFPCAALIAGLTAILAVLFSIPLHIFVERPFIEWSRKPRKS